MTVVEETTMDTAEGTELQRGLRTVVALAESGLFDEYVVYEDRGRWVFAGGVVARIVLRPHLVTTTWGAGEPTERSWSGNPAAALSEACTGLTREQWNAYGFVGFGFAEHLHDVDRSTAAGRDADDILQSPDRFRNGGLRHAHRIGRTPDLAVPDDFEGIAMSTGEKLMRASLPLQARGQLAQERSGDPVDASNRNPDHDRSHNAQLINHIINTALKE